MTDGTRRKEGGAYGGADGDGEGDDCSDVGVERQTEEVVHAFLVSAYQRDLRHHMGEYPEEVSYVSSCFRYHKS